MKNFIVLFSLGLFSLFQSGCSDEDTILAHSFSECEAGDTLTVELGATYTISLMATFTAGYKWEIQRGFDEKYVELESYSIIDPYPDSELEGEPMIQEWTYRTRVQGTVCETLIYTRAWEETPIKTKNIVVIIK